MNHASQPLTHTNRHASPRLHRRHFASARMMPHGVAESACTAWVAPQTLAALPATVVRDAGMLELLAAEMRIADLEKELQEARAMACTDPLTRAVNRRGLENAFQRELARAERSGEALSVVVFDVDNFKRVNDEHGHSLGDRALQHLVSVLREAMRPTDVIGRIGGEEFALLLVGVQGEEAQAAMTRLQGTLAAQPVPEADFSLTVSAGVATHVANESLEALLARADTAAYVAKRSGKNCVVRA
ncbi:diguanylate cyclase [Rhodocyclus gracilis]|uniref:diguanylate cyclase n=1 Tax=Rhodocyclus tenuis TaxID=1066 RepID=A0A6L5JZN7_RHOTE|nr:diguanylate cyclase [Rhodocyclus gracilis]